MKLKKLSRYIIDLDELHLHQGGRQLMFSDLKQFLLEAELAEQPVFRTGNILYFFIDADVAIFQKYRKRRDGKYLEEWDKMMVKKKLEAIKEAKHGKKKNN